MEPFQTARVETTSGLNIANRRAVIDADIWAYGTDNLLVEDTSITSV